MNFALHSDFSAYENVRACLGMLDETTEAEVFSNSSLAMELVL